jgi:crotonobetainyl-CoA:carnitine CoA-transferase CaiB-like acyl-CoA transferase
LGTQNTIFEGIKVIDLSSILAGPLAGSFFAECGAEVIKIENKITNGDATRTWKLSKESIEKSYSAYYVAANYGKTSIMLDLTHPQDMDQLCNLIRDADIVLSNFQKKVAQKFKLEPSDISKVNPKCIICQLSAYSYEDPRPGYDIVMQGETGWISMTGTNSDHLAKIPVAFIDIIASHQMREGILTALWHRERSGHGSIIHVSLYASALSALVNQGTNYLIEGHIPKPIGTMHPNIAPYGDIVTTSEGTKFLLAIGSDLQFEKLWNTLNMPMELLPIFASNQLRVEKRSLLIEMLQSYSVRFSALEWVSILEKINVPYCQIRNLEDVFNVNESKAMVHYGYVDGDLVPSLKNIAYTIHPIQYE